MGGIGDIQLFLLFLGGTICALIFLFSSIVRYQSAKRKRSLLHLELVTSLLLFADYFSYIYKDDASALGGIIVRVTNFLLFFLIYAELLGLNRYLRTFVYETSKGGAIALNLVNIFAYIGLVNIFINLYTGHIYSIDAGSVYNRGSLFFLSYIPPLLIYLVILTVVIKYRKIFPKLIFISLLSFAVLPLTCSFLQIFFFGTSLMNLSIGFCAIILFALSLIDQNFFLLQIASREKATGLPNAYGYIMEIRKLMDKGKLKEYNAIHFDIKRMGLINRKYGGATGSEIIIKYARKLRELIAEDEVLGRLGGNYFVALIRKENTRAFLDLLRKTEITISLQNGPEKVSISSVAGIYGIESDDIEPELIMNNVSMAGNIAKYMKHKPYIFLTQELQKEINEMRSLQELIPKCMAKKEFKPYYQPKVDVSKNELCGAEALVRWEHEGKIISPIQFIPVLEQNESICVLDFYMLDYVCQDIRKWLDEGRSIPTISVNFSRKNLGNPILAEEISNVLKKHNVPEKYIQIEITETIDEFPQDYLKGVVLALQGYGMSAAIDDFGTGSASINLIREVPFNVLKIDKSFISSNTDKDSRLLGHIISMGNDVGASVICEGVENKEQLEVLKKLGCPQIQGFYFDMPLSKSEFEKRLDNPQYN